MELQTIGEKISAEVCDDFEKNGKHDLTIYVCGDGKVGIAPIPYELVDNRQNALYSLGRAFGNDPNRPISQVDAIFSSSEAWYSKHDKDTAKIPRPSQDPNKKEVVFIAGMTRWGEIFFKAYEILEKDHKRILIENKELNSRAENYQANLLNVFWQGYMNL
jgi:hypothetical protein